MANAQLPSREELEMIRDTVLLPFMLTMVERNVKDLELSTGPLRKLYISATQVLMDRIHADLTRVNRELRARNIKVFKDESRMDDDLFYCYICRGYESTFSIMREVAKANISVKMGEEIQRMINDMKIKRTPPA